MRFLLLLALCIFCSNVLAMMCGPPDSVESVREGSYIYEVKFTGYTESGIHSFEFDNRITQRPYLLLNFEVLTNIQGVHHQEIYIMYFLDKGLGNYIASPPNDVEPTYLVSVVATENNNGTRDQPFIHGPCDLQQRT